MAENKKISELTRVSSLTGAEIVPFAKDGSNGAVTTAKLKEYAQPDLSAITTALGGKVDKVTGKGLSANDYTDEDKAKLDALPIKAELDTSLASKQPAITTTDDLSLSAQSVLGLTDKAKMAELIATATAAGAVFNRNSGYFELNTLTDITAPQMRVILEWGRYERIYNIANASAYSIVDALPRLRTTIPAVSASSIKMSYPLFNWTLLGLEIIKFSLNSPTTFTVFNLDSSISLLNQTSLVAILDRLSPVRGGIRIGGIPLTKLSTIFIHELRYDINLANLSALSLASLQYLVTNAANTSAITVTVHPDVYAKLTGDTTNAAAAALSADELAQWQSLVSAAAAKNISFATV